MVFKVHAMKKEKIVQKTKDKILWEDFVAKNKIKKKIQTPFKLNQATKNTKLLYQRTILFLILIKS